ncbi:Predicted PurR-regulated permease PerM [Chryseolinea serpens]|uniref:Predicted PurR-regulated permease PerM n=1 Tax=Chryseolinea serpens TaxID=947013 RepID=A0A1M5WYU8_9BACT|nr:AI-2E family transporter [Chryseolinea serpens]SHH92478.1 Predicted PurR-regulated permease PerM [Chryseolinea serpens]
MDATPHASPFYLKLSLTLLAVVLLGLLVFLGKDILLPLLFSVLLSTLLLPFTAFLQRKGVHKVFSILIPVLLSFFAIAGVLYVLSSQVVNFLDDIPALKERISEVSTGFQKWVNENTHITVRKQNQYIAQAAENLKEQVPQLVGMTFISLTGLLSYLIFLPLYTFLILYHKNTIKTFLIGVFRNGSEQRVREVLTESTTIGQHYVFGLLIETSIVFGLNTIGFLVLGIKYAIFLALLAALLNLVPYVGMIVANMLCMLVTLVSSDTLGDVVWVGVVLAVVQLFDNNIGMPMIVSNKVRINALVTIVGVLIGGALCGVPGMFLAIPAMAVCKVIFDKVPELNPWGVLFGDECPDTVPAQHTRVVLSKIKTFPRPHAKAKPVLKSQASVTETEDLKIED